MEVKYGVADDPSGPTVCTTNGIKSNLLYSDYIQYTDIHPENKEWGTSNVVTLRRALLNTSNLGNINS